MTKQAQQIAMTNIAKYFYHPRIQVIERMNFNKEGKMVSGNKVLLLRTKND